MDKNKLDYLPKDGKSHNYMMQQQQRQFGVAAALEQPSLPLFLPPAPGGPEQIPLGNPPPFVTQGFRLQAPCDRGGEYGSSVVQVDNTSATGSRISRHAMVALENLHAGEFFFNYLESVHL